MTKNNPIKYLNFKRIYGRTWTIDTVYHDGIFLDFLKENNITEYKFDHKYLGSLMPATITFEDDAEEAHFILLINSVKA